MSDALDTVDSMIVKIRKAFFRVNTLWQRKDGLWQANLRSMGGTYFNFGHGVGAEIALQMALDKALVGSKTVNDPGPSLPDDERPFNKLPHGDSDAPELPDADPADVDDMMGLAEIGESLLGDADSYDEGFHQRYWWHPESASLFYTAAGAPRPASDGLLEEITEDQYKAFAAKLAEEKAEADLMGF